MSDLASAFAVLDEAYDTHQPTVVYALFSGGHDSLTATTIAAEWAKARKIHLPVAHVNTGTGIAETRDFVLAACEQQGWPILELHPPRSYRSLVLEMGFPGPGFHDRLAYPRLKERCIRTLCRMAGGKAMLVTGIRQQESTRRMAHVERVQVERDRVWAAPIFDWSKQDCREFIDARGLPRNPVSDLLGMSGECLCGAMASPGELNMIAGLYPEKAAEIRALEDEAEAKGLRACRWGQRPPAVAKEQLRAFLTPSDGSIQMLCHGCGKDPVEEAA